MNDKRRVTASVGIDFEKFGLTLAREAPDDGIIYADAERVVRFWNHGAERIFGLGEAEALGEPLDFDHPPKPTQASPGRLRRNHAEWENAVRCW